MKCIGDQCAPVFSSQYPSYGSLCLNLFIIPHKMSFSQIAFPILLLSFFIASLTKSYSFTALNPHTRVSVPLTTAYLCPIILSF